MTIKEALRRGLVTVFCPRCQWKLTDAAAALVKSQCPNCHEYGLDSVIPGQAGPV